MSNFINNVKAEFSKVVWPGWAELKDSTIITLLVTVFFTLFVWGADNIISMLATLVY